MRRIIGFLLATLTAAPVWAAPDIAATVTAIASIRSSTAASHAPDGK